MRAEIRFLQKFTRFMALFFLVFFILALFIWQFTQNRKVLLEYLDQQGTKHSLTLTVRERKRLHAFMQKLFAEGNFAYTVLGDKPVSWENYINPLPIIGKKHFRMSFSHYYRTLRVGWKVWERYQHLFPSAHIVAESSTSPGWTSILVINEERFNDVVNSNMKDFQKVLGRDILDGSQLLEEAKKRPLIDEILEGHQALIGIVLGYGRENSWKFMEGCKNCTPIDWVWGEDKNYFVEEPEKNLSLTDYYLSQYSCPSFSGDPSSEESIKLKTEYMQTRQKVMEYYKDKDFLEATLSLLAGYRP